MRKLWVTRMILRVKNMPGRDERRMIEQEKEHRSQGQPETSPLGP